MFVSITFIYYLTAEGKMVKDINSVNAVHWNRLAQEKIYFGHQSVGYDIIDGLRSVMVKHPEIKLNIVEIKDLAAIKAGMFSHSQVGKNEDPASKTNDFALKIEAADGAIDIAFHKYCYVDVNATTDVEKIFAHYKEKMNYLQQKYPDTKFVHITMPLTTVQKGIKAWIKKILGQPLGGEDSNVKRNRFNKLIISEYQGKAPVFDIASVEATKPDGKMTIFVKGDSEYLAMYPGYSNDGGHLNSQGQKTVAEQLLVFLAGLN
jgi:hypothetical protein